MLKTPELLLRDGHCPSCVSKAGKGEQREGSLIFQLSLLDVSDSVMG
jgi:hypothetical protein